MAREHLQGAGLKQLAETLAFPRRSGGPGADRIVGLVAGRLRRAGLDVAVEPFSFDLGPAERALRVILVGSAVLLGAAGVIGDRWPGATAVLAAAAMVPGLVFLAWTPRVGSLYAAEGPTPSANVVGRRTAPEPRLTLLVMAHHDSKSQSPSLPVRLGLTALALVGAAVVVALALTQLTGVDSGLPSWVLPASAAVAVLAIGLLALMRSGDRSPGGLDNAGSLAILLELARVLPGEMSDDVELLFVATGAEEEHMVGARRWLDRHAAELVGRPAYCINLDGAGAPGRTVLIERYGFGRLFSRQLSAAARRAAAWLGIPVRGILMLPGLGTDAIPVAHAGVPCLTVASGSVGRATLAVHSRRDVADNLDPAALQRVAALVRGTVHELARTVR